MAEINRWEQAGIGVAPFKCVGMFQMPNKETATMQDYQSLPKVTKGGAGCCYVCGTGLIFNYIVKDAKGDTFIVGCDCINKMGDTILTKQARAIRKEKRDAQKILERKAARDARMAELEIEREEGRKEIVEQYGEFFDKLDALNMEWVDSIINSVMQYGRISEKQLVALQNALSRHEEISKRKNEFFGEIGKRVTVTLKVDRWIQISAGDYMMPPCYIVIMHDEEGRTFKYKGSGGCLPSSGETTTIKCTIKEHECYNDVKQTTIQRPAKVQ